MAKYNTKNYDYLIVGAGPFGSTFAREAAERGKKVLIIDKRAQTGGNMASHKINGVNVHMYGAHIFHTNDREVWEYVHKWGDWLDYQNHVVANYKGEMYSLPFNMYTFNKMWPEVTTPEQAQAKINAQKAEFIKKLNGREPANLEEQAISLIGTDVYHKLIKGYTEKQWGRPATEIPAFVIKRLPVRLTYENNYFNDRFQALPEDGYDAIFAKLLDHENIDVLLNQDFLDDRETFLKEFNKIVYTGPIDAFYDYKFGELEYRGLKFVQETIDSDNAQGNSVINYTDAETPFTRVMEWRHFDGHADEGKTVLTHEYPQDWKRGDEAYYPLNNDRNAEIYAKYQEAARAEGDQIIFGGRLAEYKYYNMDQTFRSALDTVKKYLS